MRRYRGGVAWLAMNGSSCKGQYVPQSSRTLSMESSASQGRTSRIMFFLFSMSNHTTVQTNSPLAAGSGRVSQDREGQYYGT